MVQLVHDAQARIRVDIFVEDQYCFLVGAPIIHGDDLDLLQRLIQQRIKTLPDTAAAVVDWDDH